LSKIEAPHEGTAMVGKNIFSVPFSALDANQDHLQIIWWKDKSRLQLKVKSKKGSLARKN